MPDLLTTYALSATASCVAESATFPLDMLKTRLQAQGERASERGAARLGLASTLRGIVAREGVLSLAPPPKPKRR